MIHVNNSTESHKGTYLTYEEMVKIEGHKENGLSNCEIGRLLKRVKQTINNAIHAGRVTQKRQQKQNGKTYTYYDEDYSAKAHWEAYMKNRLNCGRCPKWVEMDEFIGWADTKMLEDKCPPDTVVEKAKEKFPSSIVPCTSTLYNWVDSGIMKTKNIDLLEKVGRKPRETKGKERRNKKVHGTSIEERPESVEHREEFGHWEIDKVIGNKDADEPVLLTLVEQKTRFEKIFKIASQKASDVDKTLKPFIKQLNGLEGEIFKTVTSDNGSDR